MSLPGSSKLKKLPLILGSALVATSNLSANLIINGDFETGLSGGGYGSYGNEVGLFSAPTLSDPIYNESNWLIAPTYQAAEFKDLHPPSPNPQGWGIRMGRYSDSYVTNTATMSLEQSVYKFSAKHWGESPGSIGSEFTATLVGVGKTEGYNQIIGTFIDETEDDVQVSSKKFTLEVAGDYQLRLSGSGDLNQSSRAWLDDLTLVDIPESSLVSLFIGLSSISLISVKRKAENKN